ncbi:hypothetical protein HX001_14465 [Empedobacter brevis]|uniref:Phage tail tape measure protein n=1 Tax=Empedobacter brevis TaxID=247 RepID=A0AAJ1QGK5_9FLAO|nr:hypothetical protein [Empedobacter brevis]MDM1073690.1 hypothetical protein [Empedobacter brevis]
MSKEITLPLEPAFTELLKFRKEIQNLSEDFVKAAAEAMNSSKNFHAAFTNVKFDEVVRKNAEANEKMRESTEKLSKANEGYNRAQENVIKISATTRREWTNVIGSLDDNIKANERLKNELELVRAEMKKATGSKAQFIKQEFELKQAISDNNIIIRQQVKELQAADGSSTKFSVTLGLMKKAYRELNQAEKESDFGVNLMNEIHELDIQMKNADASIGNFHRNVGNYSPDFVESFGNMRNAWSDLFSGNILGAIESFQTGFSSLKESLDGLTITTTRQTIATNINTESNTVNTAVTATNTTATTANTIADNLNTTSTGANTVAVEANTVANVKNTNAINETSIASSNAAKGGLSSFTNGIKNMTAWVLRFIATPTGMVIGGITIALLAGVVAIGTYIKSVWDYNKSIKETLTLTKQLSGEVGKSADLIRQKVQAISDTFNTDFNETIQAAKKLSENFNIPFNKALDEINLGLIKGGRYNKEYLDSINEYPVFFDKAGYSVSEFIDMINESFDQGVYNDKFIDGIKEADIALREQTKSTRDALVNAYGASFTDDILQRIRIGATSTKDALNELAQKAKEVNLNEQQYAQLTADLYKSAGEDVGGAAKMFDIYRASVENANRPLTETELKLKNLEKANQDLGKAMDNALKSDTIVTLQQNFELFWIQTKIIFFELISFIKDGISWLDRMTGASDAMGVAWVYIQAVAKSFMEVIKTFKELAAVIGLNAENSDILKFAFKALLIPVKMLVDFLQRVTTTLRTLSLVTQEAIGFIVALKTTIAELNFSNITNFFSSLGDNIKKVRDLKKELQASTVMETNNDHTLKMLDDVNKRREKDADIERKRKEDQARIDKENAEKAAKEAEKAAKKKEELAKKYAAEEKKRKEEAERLAEKAYQEELALMQANLEFYKLKNLSEIDSNTAFTEAVMNNEKAKLKFILDEEIKFAEKKSRLNLKEVQEKEASGKKLTSTEVNLLKDVYSLNANHNKEILELEDSYRNLGLKQKEELLKLDLLSKIANGEDQEKAERWYNDAVYDLRKQNFRELTKLNEEEIISKFYTGQKLSEIERQYVEYVLNQRKGLLERKIDDDKTDKENSEKELNNKIERDETYLDYLGSVLGAEREMRDVFNAYKKLQYDTDFNNQRSVEMARLGLVASMASAASNILGEQTAFGKAAAVVSATINTYLAAASALAPPPIGFGPIAGIPMAAGIAALGLLQVTKIITQKPPKVPQFQAPQFAKGITNSVYEGPAIVDEIGAEIHLDKKGNIKSMGENKGPRLTQVKKGDTIIPSRFSEKIKAMLQTRLMPETPAMNTLLLGFPIGNTQSKKDYDFQRLEKKMDKLIKVSSTKKDKNYLLDDGKIIEVTTKANGTHQRYIDKIDSQPKNRPSRLN